MSTEDGHDGRLIEVGGRSAHVFESATEAIGELADGDGMTDGQDGDGLCTASVPKQTLKAEAAHLEIVVVCAGEHRRRSRLRRHLIPDPRSDQPRHMDRRTWMSYGDSVEQRHRHPRQLRVPDGMQSRRSLRIGDAVELAHALALAVLTLDLYLAATLLDDGPQTTLNDDVEAVGSFAFAINDLAAVDVHPVESRVDVEYCAPVNLPAPLG